MKQSRLLITTLIFILAAARTLESRRPLERGGVSHSASSESAVSANGARDAEVEARIARVENGLLPPVVIGGEATPGMKLADRMAFYKVPGVSVAVINQGRIEWARGYGLADVAEKRPVTPETRFQAASISKSVAATAALHLVEEGKLDLDRNVNDYLKSWKVPDNEFTKEQKVTLRRILSHSAGLTVHGFPGYEAGTPVATLVQVLNGEKPANTDPIRVDLVPGSKWRYSGGGYTVMQQMLIDVTGQPFPEIMQRVVLSKFGMKNSAYSQPLRSDWRPYAATAYRPDGKMVEGEYHTYPELAAAGLWTTPSDLARFAIGIQQTLAGHSNGVISQKMAGQMLTRQIAEDGLGVFVEGAGPTLRFSHGGANEGFRCNFIAYAQTGQGAAVMTNSDSGGDIASEIMFAIAHEYGWPDYAPKVRTKVKVDPAIFKDYVGRYQLQPGFVITVSARDGRLFTQGTGQSEAEMFPESVTTFFMVSDDIEIVFKRDPAGKVNAFEVHQGGQNLTAKRME
ncbi:MAG TPA: serine hydrolase [Terriglobia bacterium]|nr:serine hydrolase [Terriglobia bacterium]